jgi:uncharacterized protein YlbG (UPF0298 family)
MLSKLEECLQLHVDKKQVSTLLLKIREIDYVKAIEIMNNIMKGSRDNDK